GGFASALRPAERHQWTRLRQFRYEHVLEITSPVDGQAVRAGAGVKVGRVPKPSGGVDITLGIERDAVDVIVACATRVRRGGKRAVGVQLRHEDVDVLGTRITLLLRSGINAYLSV